MCLVAIRGRFNPAEAEEGFKRERLPQIRAALSQVSIQPKPKKGLKEEVQRKRLQRQQRFNSAEAEEGFKRNWYSCEWNLPNFVSIQPKPKKGLKVGYEDDFIRPIEEFQSSRSRRKV